MATTPKLRYMKSAELKKLRQAGTHPERDSEIDVILLNRKQWAKQQSFEARLDRLRESKPRVAPRRSPIQKAFDSNPDWGFDYDFDGMASHNDAYTDRV